jgi:Fe-S cluster assembly protein SufD
MKTTQKIILNQTESPVSLKEILAAQLQTAVPTELMLTIEVPAHLNVTLCDDLITYGSLEQSVMHQFTFIVHEQAHLNYFMRVTPEAGTEHLSVQSLTSAPIVEKELTINLVGEQAQATLSCACLSAGSEVFKFTTLQHHHAAHTTSRLSVRAVLDQKSKLFCNSMIKVEKAAQHTNAHLENKNILLSNGSRAVSIPQLEIEANDVKCGHGAAVSKLNNDDIFYLESRGINAQATQRLLVDAFLSI